MDRAEEAAATILLETGKTEADARGEIDRAVETLRWNGEQAGRVQATMFPGAVAGSRRTSIPTSLGPVAVITAWNFPAVLATRKLGAALAAGCTVVFKASEFAPATARLVVEVLVDAGLPAGVVNLVFGDPRAVSEQLTSSLVDQGFVVHRFDGRREGVGRAGGTESDPHRDGVGRACSRAGDG